MDKLFTLGNSRDQHWDFQILLRTYEGKYILLKTLHTCTGDGFQAVGGSFSGRGTSITAVHKHYVTILRRDFEGKLTKKWYIINDLRLNGVFTTAANALTVSEHLQPTAAIYLTDMSPRIGFW